MKIIMLHGAIVFVLLPFLITGIDAVWRDVFQLPSLVGLSVVEMTMYCGTVGAILWAMYAFCSEKIEREDRARSEDYSKELCRINSAKRDIAHAHPRVARFDNINEESIEADIAERGKEKDG